MCDIVREMVVTPSFNDKESVTSFLRESVSRLEAACVSSGTIVNL